MSVSPPLTAASVSRFAKKLSQNVRSALQSVSPHIRTRGGKEIQGQGEIAITNLNSKARLGHIVPDKTKKPVRNQIRIIDRFSLNCANCAKVVISNTEEKMLPIERVYALGAFKGIHSRSLPNVHPLLAIDLRAGGAAKRVKFSSSKDTSARKKCREMRWPYPRRGGLIFCSDGPRPAWNERISNVRLFHFNARPFFGVTCAPN